jgi:hypothetical protein
LFIINCYRVIAGDDVFDVYGTTLEKAQAWANQMFHKVEAVDLITAGLSDDPEAWATRLNAANLMLWAAQKFLEVNINQLLSDEDEVH